MENFLIVSLVMLCIISGNDLSSLFSVLHYDAKDWADDQEYRDSGYGEFGYQGDGS